MGRPPSGPAVSPGGSGGQKLSEALGFGASSTTPTVVPISSASPREPRRAYTAPLPREGDTAGTPAAAFDDANGVAPSIDPAAVAAPAQGSRPTPETGVMVRIPAGRFLYGEDKRTLVLPEFEIDRDPVTHADYERFVVATGHRPPLYWKTGRCPEDLREHPVVGVDFFDAAAYARWAGKDLPFEDEWERGARGADGRAYPWGDEPDLAANTARTGLKMTLPVGFYPKNASPDGVRDLVGNAWEITHSPAPGAGVVVRGGSWFDFALYSKTWFRSSARTDARNGTIGFRCVRRAAARPDAVRAVSDGEIEAAVAARKSRGELPDPTSWNADRRDLVIDVRRLRAVVATRDEEAGVEAKAVAGAAPARPAVRKAFVSPTTAPAPTPAPTPAPMTSPAAPTRPPAPAIAPAAAAAAAAAAVASGTARPATPAVPSAPAPASRPLTPAASPAPPPMPAAASAPARPPAPVVVPPSAVRPPSSVATPAAATAPAASPTRAPASPAAPATSGGWTGEHAPAPFARPLGVAPLNPLSGGPASPAQFAQSAPATPTVPVAPPRPPSPAAPLSAPQPPPIAARPSPPPSVPSTAAAAAAGAAAGAVLASKLAPAPASSPTPPPIPPPPVSGPRPLGGLPPMSPRPSAPPSPTPVPPAPSAPIGAAAAARPSSPVIVPPPPIGAAAAASIAGSTAGSTATPAARPGGVPPPAPKPAPAAVAREAIATAASSAAAATSPVPRTATTSGATAREETSPLRFALIVMGFLTVCVLAVAAVLHASRSSDAVESDPAKLKLPELVSDPLDEQLPTLLAPKADSLGIDAPGVLLVFSDGTAGPGVRAAKLAVEMHRRLRGSATRVVLVVPRETVTSEAEADDALLKDQLRGMGVIGDLPVLLDSADDGGPGHRRRTQWQMKDPIGAILLRDGVEWMRVTPPTSSDGLVRENLAALVKAAASVPPR